MCSKSFVSFIIGGVIGFVGATILPTPTHTEMTNHDMSPSSPHDMDTEMLMHMDMQPEPVAVAPDTPVPAVRIVDTIKDKMGAYSVRVELDNYTITPEKIDQPPATNEGHLHVYVDGEKVGREYAEWIYIPSKYFMSEGPHRITVSLNANTHAAWTFAEAPIEATALVE
jgi:hypothetical protein